MTDARDDVTATSPTDTDVAEPDGNVEGSGNYYRVWAAVYALIYLLLTPLTVLIMAILYLVSRLRRLVTPSSKRHVPTTPDSGRRRVLIGGAPYTKALHVIRALGKAGHIIILTQHHRYRFSAGRYSKYVTRYYTVPDGTGRRDTAPYVAAMVRIALEEKVDWFVPVSHTETSVADAVVRQEIQKAKPEVRCLIFDSASLAERLDDKLTFSKECQKLGLPVPDFREVNTTEDIRKLGEEGLFDDKHYFLKPLTLMSEDREDFTRIPGHPLTLTSYLSRYENSITPRNRFYVTQYVKGDEYTANAIVRDGRLVAYDSCPRPPLTLYYGNRVVYNHKMFYRVVKHDRIKEWVQTFCSRLSLTGFICFDFIVDDSSDEIYCLECNPRLHSSIVSYDYRRLELAIRAALEGGNESETIEPRLDSAPVYWLYNELSRLVDEPGTIRECARNLVRGRDVVWDAADPLPFLVLNHLQIPHLLLEFVATGNPWRRVHHCMGYIR